MLPEYAAWGAGRRGDATPKSLYPWYTDRAGTSAGYDVLDKLLQYDSTKRLTAAEALRHPWFTQAPLPTAKYVPSLTSAFQFLPNSASPYPKGRVARIAPHPIVPTRRADDRGHR